MKKRPSLDYDGQEAQQSKLNTVNLNEGLYSYDKIEAQKIITPGKVQIILKPSKDSIMILPPLRQRFKQKKIKFDPKTGEQIKNPDDWHVLKQKKVQMNYHIIQRIENIYGLKKEK